MNAARIAAVLSALQAEAGNEVAFQAHALLSELCGPDGAIAVADDAAFDLLGLECSTEVLDGVTWYHLETSSVLTNLFLEEEDTVQQMQRTVRYVAARRLLVAHPSNPRLVRRA